MQRVNRDARPALRLITDAYYGGRNAGMYRDMPVTFHISARSYTYREIEEHIPVKPPEVMHDPMLELL